MAEKFDLHLDTPPRAPTFALAVVAIICVGYLGVVLLGVAGSRVGAGSSIACGIAASGVAVMQIRLASHALRGFPLRGRALILTLQALLTLLPHLAVGELWNGVPGFLISALLLSTRGKAGWILAGCVAVATPVLVYPVAHDVVAALSGLIPTSVLGMSLFALVRLAKQVSEVHSLRTDLAQLAVTQERLRFARDLHDLVGYTLSSASIRAELSHRLLSQDPHAARLEMAALIDTIRQTHMEVRKVARGYRELCLDSELISARLMLGAAGITPHFSHHGIELSRTAGSALAAVLREAVTNVVRHSAARHCTVRLTQGQGTTRLIVINDRPHPARREAECADESGLRNLSERVTLLGGTLLVSRPRLRSGEQFRLEARLPVEDVASGPAGPGGAPRARRLLTWASDPALLQGDPNGVDAVSGP
ncbi:sensor histidine kinase [Streptomyces lydicus]|uniref:sensor histidine kinase n=1 Tax=Streptomyces lydicus TaxID=47763 RepID=UPI002870409F|nr:histidine kinase [Streptomyces lydicus]